MAKQAEPVEGYLDDEFAKFRTQRLNKGKEPHVEPNARAAGTLAQVEEPPPARTRGTGKLTKLDEHLAAKREEARAATVRMAPVEVAAPVEPEAPSKHHPHCVLLDMDPSRGTKTCNCQVLDPASAAHKRPTQAPRRSETKVHGATDSRAHALPETRAHVSQDTRAHAAPETKAHAAQETRAHAKPESKGHAAPRLEPDAGQEGTARGTRRIAVLPPEEASDDFERFRAKRLRESEAARQVEPAAPAEHITVDAGVDAFEAFRAQRLRDSKRHKAAGLAGEAKAAEAKAAEESKAEAPKAEPEVVDPEFERFRAEREKALEEQRKAEEALAAVPVVERPAETALLGAVVEEKKPASDDDGMFFGTNHRERVQISAATREHRGDTPAAGLDVDAVVAAAEAAKSPDEAKHDEAKRRAPPPPLPTR